MQLDAISLALILSWCCSQMVFSPQKYTFFTEKCKLMILFFEVARLLGHLTPIFAPDF